ncbi:MAG: DUF5667 domain-containing protein [Chloroflexota bacterium]
MDIKKVIKMIKNKNNDEIDPLLNKMLQNYAQAAPQRDPLAEKGAREKYIQKVQLFLENQNSSTNPSISGNQITQQIWISTLNQLKENFIMKLNQPARSALTLILVLVIFLFGGSGITAYASGNSLPGDALYPVKISLESARASLASDQADQARIYFSFAGQRLEEIKTLLETGQTSNIVNTGNLFKTNIEKALDVINNLSKTDPTKAAALRIEATSTLTNYDNTLKTLLASAPSDIEETIKTAIDASQPTLLSENENNNTNEQNNDNGNLNNNDNTDDKSNDNANLNSNDNTNDQSNDNGNLNSNDNTDDKSNDNANLNSNDNTDDQSNDNANLNSNDNSDDQSNDNANLNSNDNSDDQSNDNANNNNTNNNDNANRNDNNDSSKSNNNNNSNNHDNNKNDNSNKNGNN